MIAPKNPLLTMRDWNDMWKLLKGVWEIGKDNEPSVRRKPGDVLSQSLSVENKRLAQGECGKAELSV